MNIRSIITAALLIGATSVQAADNQAVSAAVNACPGYMRLRGYWGQQNAWLKREFDAFRKFTPDETMLEHGRICIAMNDNQAIEESIYHELATCRDHGVPGLDQPAAVMAGFVAKSIERIKGAGC